MPRKEHGNKNPEEKGGFFRRRFGRGGEPEEDFSAEFEFADDDDDDSSSFASAFSDYDPELELTDDDLGEEGRTPGDAAEEVPAGPAEEIPEEIPEEPAEEIPEEIPEEETADGLFVIADDAEEAEPEDDDAEIPEEETFFEGGIETPVDGRMGSTDMNLRIALGLEEEEKEAKVRDRVKKLGDQIETDVRQSKPVRLDCPEFTDQMQAKGIAAGYKRAAKFYNVRLVISAILTLVLLIYENIPAITTLFTGKPKQLSGVVDPAVFPVVYTMVSLQILFVICAVGYKEIRSGVRSLFIGAPTVLSLTVLPLLTCTVHSIVSAVAATSRFEPVLFNSVAALAVTLSILSARLNNKREMMTFSVAGTKREKYAMCRLHDEEILDEVDAIDPEEDVGDVMKIEKIRFVDSFFARTQAPDQTRHVFVVAIIGVCLVLGVLAGSFHFVRSGRINEALTLAILLSVTVMPMSAYIAYSYPFYRAARAAKSVDSAIIGDVSLDEYAGASVVALDDTNLFPSVGVKVQNIRIYNNARIDRVLYYAASAFARAGGPLSDIFEIATMDMNKSGSVEILDAADGFLATKIDGVNIFFGSYDELRRRGADIAEEIAVDDVDFSDEMSIMYMIREDKLVSKLYIKYDIDADIDPILKQLGDGGVYMCIRTYDPNINEAMIASKVEMNDPPVKVIRFREEGEVGAVKDRADSGIVTTGSPKALLQLIPFCDSTERTKRDCMVLGIVSAVISAVIVLLIFISGGVSRVSSLFVAAYQLAWLLPAYLISKIFVR